MGRACSALGGAGECIQGFSGKVRWKPLGRPRRRRVDNIKMDIREMGWDGMGWYCLD
jgi:hypothetical protein